MLQVEAEGEVLRAAVEDMPEAGRAPVEAAVERMPEAVVAGFVLPEAAEGARRESVAAGVQVLGAAEGGPVLVAVEHVPVVEEVAVGRVLAEAVEGVRHESLVAAEAAALGPEAAGELVPVAGVGMSVAVEHGLVAVAGALRRSVAPRRSVIRTRPRELAAELRASLDILPRASVPRRVFAMRARRPVCDKGAARRWEPGISVAGPG